MNYKTSRGMSVFFLIIFSSVPSMYTHIHTNTHRVFQFWHLILTCISFQGYILYLLVLVSAFIHLLRLLEKHHRLRDKQLKSFLSQFYIPEVEYQGVSKVSVWWEGSFPHLQVVTLPGPHNSFPPCMYMDKANFLLIWPPFLPN